MIGTHVNFIEFPNLKNIRELNLHCNFVSRFPAAINKLPQLRLLELGSNSISRLSIELFSLQHMRVLSLYENH
jgi:Leucine-rich repeat (LRR) protein